MKTKQLIIIAAAFGIVGSAYAEEAKPDREHRKLPREIIEKFDTDGDGKLNQEERKAARAARKQMMLEKFDKDGDGTLNDDEKAAMREAMKDRPGGPRAGGGKKHGSRDGSTQKAAE